ncbi:hypothetical protein [Ralstonia pseudosolanacearum]|uniref:hypothetical protein n=1 Tax=Ralstonia pseudosolanacearum TaxID=1310165 RepID=UPI0030CE09DE
MKKLLDDLLYRPDAMIFQVSCVHPAARLLHAILKAMRTLITDVAETTLVMLDGATRQASARRKLNDSSCFANQLMQVQPTNCCVIEIKDRLH